MKHARGASRSGRTIGILFPIVGLLAAGCGGGGDDDPTEAAGEGGTSESCYEGENATFVVPYAPGGGYDVIARAVAPALEDVLGGTVVIENQPGAGGLVAASALMAGDDDGLTFAILPGVGILGASLAEVEGAAFDPLDFTFITRVAPDERLMVTGPESGFETIEDVLDDGAVRFASTGPGGADHIDSTVVSRILELDGELITGFAGSGETALAVTAGDADAVFSSVAGLTAGVESGDLAPVLIAGSERTEDLPDVPTLLELDLDDDQRALAEAHSQLQAAGRSIVAPPGVPASCVTELQDAFRTVVEDPEVLDLLEPSNERISYLSGADLEEIYRSVLQDSPEEYVALLRESFQGQ